MNDFLKLMLCFIISFLLCSFFCKGYIYFSKKREVQQYIRKDIVETHQKKKGTPTMGGCILIGSTLISFLLFVPKFYLNNQMLAIIFIFLFFGIIGMMDDLFKIIYKNSDGLSAKLRLLLELIGSLVALYLMQREQIESLSFPLIHISIPVGSFLIVYYLFVLMGTANAVNFTDGLDGLASGLMISAILPLLEIVSVILQVGFFKLSHGKRIFKMAPIHHHFEKKGVPEWKVVMSFWMIGFILAMIASMIGVMG